MKTPTRKALSLIYEDRRGASVCLMLSASEARRRIKTLRRPARLMLGDVQVGGVDEADGGQDDQRIRWIWWYDSSALEPETTKGGE